MGSVAPLPGGAVNETRPIIVAITGASGAIYGVRALQLLQAAGVTSHLVLSAAGELTCSHELGMSRAQVVALADVVHPSTALGASIASGSFNVAGMLIAPCSMRTLGEIASGVTSSLVTRAADVMLKERRRLVLLARETPLNLIHLRNMTTVTEAGGIIAPPVPAFYTKPQSLDDVIDQTVARALSLLDVELAGMRRWSGLVTDPDLEG